MKRHPRIKIIGILTILSLAVWTRAQEPTAAEQLQPPQLRYRLVEIGTFGGHNSSTNGGTAVINRHGTVVGTADTGNPCPYIPDLPIAPAFKWRNGVMTKLPRLPGGCFGFAIAINSHGLIVGVADNGLLDPLTGQPEIHAVVWKSGKIIDLGTFGGPNSLAGAVNDMGQVVGVAQKATADPFSFGDILNLPASAQWRGFLWQDGGMRDLGTLGGPDAAAAGDLSLNEHGQVAGFSFTDDIVNPVSGVPTLNPFRWKNGRMLDLGGLGGVFGLAFTINNRGQVVGFSDIAGDQEAHAFRWNRAKMEDLGTLGGSFAGGGWINDAGEVVGASFTEGDASLRGFIWRQGVMTSLGTVDGDSCSDAYVINAKSQVVGPSFDCDGEGESHAYLWQRGVMTDLNAFVPPDSHLQLISARFINDRGEIIADGFLPNGHERAVLLIPCDKEHGERKGCRDASKSGSNLGSAIRGGGKPSQRSLAPERLAILRQRFVQGHGSLGRWPRK